MFNIYEIDTMAQCHDTFYARNLCIFSIGRLFDPARHIKCSLMLVGKTIYIAKSGAPEWCFTRVSALPANI